MSRFLFSVYIILFSVFCVSKAQELMEHCFTCDDALDRCELDCVVPVFREDSVLAWPYQTPEKKSEIDKCSTLCKSKRDACADSDLTVSCNKCMVSCSKEYETGMLSCLETQDKTKKSSFGMNLDSCANSASKTMDTCTQTCYGGKRLFSWTPEAERGEAHTPYVFDEESFARQLTQEKTSTSSKTTSKTTSTTTSTSSTVSQPKTNPVPQSTISETQSPNQIKPTSQLKPSETQNKVVKPQSTNPVALKEQKNENPTSFSITKVLSVSAGVVVAIIGFGVVVFVALTKQRLSV